ncbi:MAG: hypothetical protein DCF28_12145 [Alphaproteobacteria bacterium]|nr:MAG: hypothetical protein DCF28_12145 [Alphaproteobacteria bacterium]PZO41012.1 MAG: hypothetical protein DCE92_01110 [Alphaproteobacteria bacterium]
MLVAALASMLLVTAPQQATPAQDPADPVVDLGDIVVDGRRVEDMTRQFVGEVAAPARNRGLARWRDGVCVGVVNLKPEMAQYIADRVSTVAEDIGLKPGGPDCVPSVLVVATVDASTFTRQFVSQRPRNFRAGGSGMDLGMGALNRFMTVDRPVRWWNVSIPVDSNTGLRAVRLPGDTDAAGNATAPVIRRGAASRLTTQIVDDTQRAYIIVDVDQIQNISLEQLADYIAFVSLAQVDPDADTSGFATILNIFDDPQQVRTLTDWDKAYLSGLYQTVRTRENFGAQQTEVVDSIVRAHRALMATRDAEISSD